MSNISSFESKTGHIECSSEKIFNFVTDLRNFKRFIPADYRGNVNIESEYCKIDINMLGTVKIRVDEMVRSNKIIYAGNAPQVNDFFLILNILETGRDKSEVMIILNAEFNPFLKVIAEKPVRQLLETLINEMEKFADWEKIS